MQKLNNQFIFVQRVLLTERNMRLNNFEIQAINRIAKKYFDNDAEVFLFGSRTNDAKKGGDIDLFLKVSRQELMSLNRKVLFLSELKRNIGERKIDLVFDNPITRTKKSFYNSIIRNYIPLNTHQ